MKNVLIVLICTCFLSCDNSSNKVSTTTDSSAAISGDFSKDEQAIKDAVNDGVTKINAGDSTGFIAILSDDVEVIPAGQPSVRGEAARKWAHDFFRAYNVQLKPYSNVEVSISGDLGYHRYDYEWTVTPKNSGPTITEKGSGIHILRRQPSGKWLVIKDIWSPLPAA